MRPRSLLLCLALSCDQSSPPDEAERISEEEAQSDGSSEAAESQESNASLVGWAPVFRTDSGLEALGDGSLLAGPGGIYTAQTTGEQGPCGGRLLASTDRAVLVLPEGVQGNEPPPAPTVQAALVETAAWRLNEVLPALEEATPSEGPAQPARQKGLSIGSVSKARRHGAPPVFLVTGVRGCTAAIAILDSKLETILDHHSWEGICSPIAVMPPADLDGDDQRELAVFNSHFVSLLRLNETPGSVQLDPVTSWRCEDKGTSQ